MITGLAVIAAVLAAAGPLSGQPVQAGPSASTTVTIQNDSGQVADAVTIYIARHAVVSADPIGCGEPSYSNYIDFTTYNPLTVTWPFDCIHPGDSVTFTFESCEGPACTSPVLSHYVWHAPPVGGDVSLTVSDDGGARSPWLAALWISAVGLFLLIGRLRWRR